MKAVKSEMQNMCETWLSFYWFPSLRPEDEPWENLLLNRKTSEKCFVFFVLIFTSMLWAIVLLCRCGSRGWKTGICPRLHEIMAEVRLDLNSPRTPVCSLLSGSHVYFPLIWCGLASWNYLPQLVSGPAGSDQRSYSLDAGPAVPEERTL